MRCVQPYRSDVADQTGEMMTLAEAAVSAMTTLLVAARAVNILR
jgi:hypothetical protein